MTEVHDLLGHGTVFAGLIVGIREVAVQISLTSFMQYDSGFFDHDQNRVEPVGNNFFALKFLAR